VVKRKSVSLLFCHTVYNVKQVSVEKTALTNYLSDVVVFVCIFDELYPEL